MGPADRGDTVGVWVELFQSSEAIAVPQLDVISNWYQLHRSLTV